MRIDLQIRSKENGRSEAVILESDLDYCIVDLEGAMDDLRLDQGSSREQVELDLRSLLGHEVLVEGAGHRQREIAQGTLLAARVSDEPTLL